MVVAAGEEPSRPQKKEVTHCYPNKPSSSVALYWAGISIKAARENSASFLDRSILFDIISVKFTNYKSQKNALFWNQTSKKKSNILSKYLTWKL